MLVDSLLSLVGTPPTLKAWKKYKKRMEDLLPIRNLIAHHPLLESTETTPARTRFRYSIRIEPYEVESGRRAPRAVDAKALRQHAKKADRLTHLLAAFARKVSADAEARVKNLAGQRLRGPHG